MNNAPKASAGSFQENRLSRRRARLRAGGGYTQTEGWEHLLNAAITALTRLEGLKVKAIPISHAKPDRALFDFNSRTGAGISPSNPRTRQTAIYPSDFGQ